MNAPSLRFAVVLGLGLLSPLAANAATSAAPKAQTAAPAVRTVMAEAQVAPVPTVQASGERKVRVVLPSPYRVD